MGELGFVGGSGLLWRVNNQASTHTPSGNRGNNRPTPGPTTCQPLSNPCVPALYTGTQPAKPLGITGCPAGQWTSAGPLDKAEAQQGPPGGVLEPRRVCVTHSHFWAKIVTPSSPPSTHRPPPLPLIPPTTHTWLIEVNRGCAKVSIGCLAVGL